MARKVTTDGLSVKEAAFVTFLNNFRAPKLEYFTVPWGRDEFMSYYEKRRLDPAKVDEWVDMAIRYACDGRTIEEYAKIWRKRNVPA